MTIFEITIFWLKIAPSYYWLMYVIWFLYGIWFIKQTKKYTLKQRDSLFLYIFLGVIIWWRLGYILFYNLQTYLSDPMSILRVWEWWMSFHGWFLWVCVWVYLFAKRFGVSLWGLADDIAKIAPVWIFFGRIWNYMNKELLGFQYNWPLAVSTASWSYFPSPLIEALLEWICIFILLNFIHKNIKTPWIISSLFLIYYSIFRIGVELFLRSPDIQIWYYFGFLTQGMILSIPMFFIWCIFYFIFSRKSWTIV